MSSDNIFEPVGMEVSISGIGVYNANVRGGTSTHKRQGRWSGSYDLELSKDLSGLFGSEKSELYMRAEGGFDRLGIDDTSVGSFFGVNCDYIGRRSLDLVEVWYQQSFADEELKIRLGKLDITGGFHCRGCPVSFDGNSYANDETTQFLNGSLVNNPTIPFPDYGLGAIVHWTPVEYWYGSFGVVDAQADSRETGFNTAFHDEDYFFYAAETGVTPHLHCANGILPGAYRVGLWYDPQPEAPVDGAKERRDDVGGYLSCDQMLSKEIAAPEDRQGLGAFFRYGYANSERNEMTGFFSGGLQYQGLLDGRDDDVTAVGFSHGTFSSKATDFTQDYESVLEVYYNAQLTDSINLTPSLQYVANPGGVSGVSDALVFAVRAQMSF
ncbi:MAG: carbohydrate porin [Phycisphaerae bacterium]|nr:carbohydrate porin [Phycisphaerae bacterium]